MPKVMTDDPKFKKGSYTGQQSDGLYMDGILKEAVDIFSKRIVQDMQFLGLFCSSTFGVRTGKSTLAQQLCYYYTSEVNRRHGLNLKFDKNNVVFSTEKLIKVAYKLPKYSALILDEGDDLTEHAASEKLKEIKKFLRKSGQLNLFIILILPDFFEMPKPIAMNRSNFLIDVKFLGEFERGYFDYYNFTDKNRLYMKGKKLNNYEAHNASLSGGRFVNKYCIDEKIYREMKLRDLKEQEEKDEEDHIAPHIRRKLMIEICGRLVPYLKEKFNISQRQLAEGLGVKKRTIVEYYSIYRKNVAVNLGNQSAQNNGKGNSHMNLDSYDDFPTVQKDNYSINHKVSDGDLKEEEEGGSDLTIVKSGNNNGRSPQHSGHSDLNSWNDFLENEN